MSIFLSARWQKLVMANYVVDPAILQPFLPRYTELDLFEGKCFVSLVGFLFADTKLRGVSVPFHQTFPEVNLRFYVKRKVGDAWERGVVFISEIVPKPAIAWVANAFFQEHYSYLPMSWLHQQQEEIITAKYGWKYKGVWNNIEIQVFNEPTDIPFGGGEEFIFEHYFGFSKMSDINTGLYRVEHPRWQIYPVRSYEISCDFEAMYGRDFAHLQKTKPHSVYCAEGSAVNVYKKQVL
jgi:uncharacterized protein YqjF (DUF2071 family)